MILVDSGPLIAAAIEEDRDHRRCVDMFAALHLGAEKLLVPQTVVAEVAYSIQKLGGTDQELLFLQAIADGDLSLVAHRPGGDRTPRGYLGERRRPAMHRASDADGCVTPSRPRSGTAHAAGPRCPTR